MTGGDILCVRRTQDATAEVRTKAGYCAATTARKPYGFGALLASKTTLDNKDPWKRSMFRSRGVLCSQLYFEACMRAGVLLASIPPDRVSPAHLSASQEMDDVPLHWLELKPRNRNTA